MKEKDAKRALRIARAKRTAFGRFLCRLVGEQTGAVMMEYVVLGVLVVAAVVGMVVLFGDNIQTNFKIMIYTLTGNQAKIQQIRNEQRQTTDSEVTRTDSEHKNTRGDAGNEGGGEGEGGGDK